METTKKNTFIQGNPGRPKGAKNKVNYELRDKISRFLDGNFKKIKEDFEALKPRDRVKLYTDLLQYSVPKLQATSLDLDLEKLSDDQLQHIIDEMKIIVNENI